MEPRLVRCCAHGGASVNAGYSWKNLYVTWSAIQQDCNHRVLCNNRFNLSHTMASEKQPSHPIAVEDVPDPDEDDLDDLDGLSPIDQLTPAVH